MDPLPADTPGVVRRALVAVAFGLLAVAFNYGTVITTTRAALVWFALYAGGTFALLTGLTVLLSRRGE